MKEKQNVCPFDGVAPEGQPAQPGSTPFPPGQRLCPNETVQVSSHRTLFLCLVSVSTLCASSFQVACAPTPLKSVQPAQPALPCLRRQPGELKTKHPPSRGLLWPRSPEEALPPRLSHHQSASRPPSNLTGTDAASISEQLFKKAVTESTRWGRHPKHKEGSALPRANSPSQT